MIPETVFTMLACARLGAPHSVIFGGFSAEALHTRIDDAQCKVVVTTDGQFRRGKPSPLKPAVDEALQHPNPVEKVLVVRRTETEVDWVEGRDVWWHDVVDRQSDTHEAQPHDSEHPLFILYTSGTTGKPKGIFHTSGGYLTQAAYTSAVVHDVHPETDVYWCTADVGWVTGHSYIVYGPLANGATQVIYEGTPDTPHQGRWWELIEKYKVSILYTAPTAIRTFMKWGDDIPAKFDLSSVRMLGSVGEPINPEAWLWYRKNIGGGKAPIVDTWWQTETGGIMISPLPGVTTLEPGSAQRPIPGISAEILDDEGQPFTEPEKVGYLVLTKPWPAMLRGIWGDPERYKETYWTRFGPKYYFAGDGAKYDEKGNIWLLGRVDDVMNVSGHRLSTAEIESALVSHPSVAEAAVVGAADETTGQAVCAFVILRGDATDEGEATIQALRNHVAHEIGADREAAADHDRPRAAQDALREDHAAVAQGRRRGSRHRRRDHAGRLLGDEPDLPGHDERFVLHLTSGREKEGCRASPGTPRRPRAGPAPVGTGVVGRRRGHPGGVRRPPIDWPRSAGKSGRHRPRDPAGLLASPTAGEQA